jgi:hypothetical protein
MSRPSAEVRIAVLETRLKMADDARELQAKEYERRLDDLNHEHKRNIERNAAFVSRELHDALDQSLRTLIGSTEAKLDAKLNAMDSRFNKVTSKVYTGVGILIALQFVAEAAVLLWKR